MSFAIMRFEKLKSGGPISGSISHVCRTRLTPNADPKRLHTNRAIVGEIDAKSISAAIEQRTPAKYRRDAVRVLEFVITATSDWFDENPDQSDAYFDSAVAWLRDEFGAENVVAAVQHNDELTPHMHAYVVPVDPETGRLNAKKWVGGRGKLRQMQTEFANHQSGFGVERGKPRPGRKHKPQAEWYAEQGTLDEREAALEAREREADAKAAQAAEERQAAATALESAGELHRQVELRTEDLDHRQRQLAALERQLRERGEHLAGGEAALAQRQAEIDRAGKQLNERLLKAREQLRAWEAKRQAWIAEHRPVELSEVERLSLEFAEMREDRRILAMRELHVNRRSVADAVDRLGWVTYDDGSVTPLGRRVLVERGGIEDHEQRLDDWKLAGLDGPAPGL